MEDKNTHHDKLWKRKWEVCVLSRVIEPGKKWSVGCYRCEGVVTGRILELGCCSARVVSLSWAMGCESHARLWRRT